MNIRAVFLDPSKFTVPIRVINPSLEQRIDFESRNEDYRSRLRGEAMKLINK